MDDYSKKIIDIHCERGFPFHVFDAKGGYDSSWLSYKTAKRVSDRIRGKVYNQNYREV